MTIRVKVLIIIGVSLLCTAGLFYLTSRFTFMRGLDEIEERDTSRQVEQALGVLAYIVSDLEADTADWASWDDTYAFIEDGNEEYIQSNLVDDTFVNLGINLMVFVNSSGEVVFSKAYDPENERPVAVPSDLLTYLDAGSPLLGDGGSESFVSGLLSLRQGPLLVASQPILTSNDQGPAHGTLTFGRFLNETTINEMTAITLSPIAIRPVDNLVYADFEAALPYLVQEEPVFIRPLGEQSIGGYTLIEDIYGKSAFMMRVSLPRDAHQLGQIATGYYILSILGAGVLVGAVSLVIFQKQVLSRFGTLIQGISRIASTGDTSTRVHLGGGDELSIVAGTINGMLARLEEVGEEIRESEERYRDLFESTSDLIQSVTPAGDILYVNEAWRKALGYSPEEVVGLSFWNIVHPDAVAYWKELFEKARTEERVDIEEAVFITKEGQKITIAGSASGSVREGEEASVRAIFHDITERKRAREELQQQYEHERDLRQQLEEEIKKRIEFTRALVHELKTPITPVLAAADLLLEEVEGEHQKRLVESINRSAANLNQRIDELLDLARGEVDMLYLELSSVELVPLLNEIAYEMIPVAMSNNQTLTIDLPDSLPLAQIDRDRFRQIVVNLLGNAFKYTPAEGEITLKAREDSGNLVVEVIDTGPGINQEDQERLFQPYYRRLGDRERLSGLGLGLALSKQFVELHGGRIWVSSHQGKGSTFGFSIPLKPADGQTGGEGE